MSSLREIGDKLFASERIEGHELEALREKLYADGKIDRSEADFLAELHKRVRQRTPGFEQFFYRAIKDHMLAAGRVGPEETAWLRQLLLNDGHIEDEARNLLRQIKGEAEQTSPEFEALYQEAMKQPPERRTAGRQHR